MRAILPALLAFAVCIAHAAETTGTPISIVDRKTGPPDLSDVQVDTAPGSISATALLGLSGDSVTDVHNPRDLAVFLQGFDSSKGFGLSVTPFRSVLTPIPMSDYTNGDILLRLRAALTFGYAQATATVNALDYREHAWSIETSAFLHREEDPLIAYALKLQASGDKAAENDPCVFAPANLPAGSTGSAQPEKPALPTAPEIPKAGSPATPDGPTHPAELPPDSPVLTDMNARAAKCHALVVAAARWNASRGWLSFASGSYRGTVTGSPSRSLGNTLVVGISLGDGSPKTTADLGWLVTLGLRRSLDEPVLTTYGDATPQRKNTSLVTLRAAFGKTKLRALVEASKAHDEAPGASGRAFKRAFGLDVRVRDGMWLNFRLGRQRRIDNSGDETGSSVVLNISPSALVSLGGQ
jgi:hypothetical protein